MNHLYANLENMDTMNLGEEEPLSSEDDEEFVPPHTNTKISKAEAANLEAKLEKERKEKNKLKLEREYKFLKEVLLVYEFICILINLSIILLDFY